VQTGEGADILPGNAMPIRFIPPGTQLHNLELQPGKGAQVVRAAGGSAPGLLSKEGEIALVKLPSGEVRKFVLDCMATDRAGRESRPRECYLRQGWPHPLARKAAYGARRGDESCRPSARRW